ncbi:hypothetical protein [Eubacterium sp.]|uniref:hypothetical protein n=1 Tax=Eubacterium sp. TaxID=142586 RepID=UPI0026E0B88F|nr:hypothetical protein [Eubacterium sp.]MDO5431538.1 hypothetical protein [Eubacterium sp.]
MEASRTTDDYVKYVHEYLKNYYPYVETAVWPDEIAGAPAIKIIALDKQKGKTAILKLFVPPEQNWYFSLTSVKNRINKQFGYTVLY